MAQVTPVTSLPARNAVGATQLTQARGRLNLTLTEVGITAQATLLRREEGGDWVKTPVTLALPTPSGDLSASLTFDVDQPQDSPHYDVLVDGNASKVRAYLANVAPLAQSLATLNQADGDVAAVGGAGAAGSSGKAADAAHVHPSPKLDALETAPQALTGAGAANLTARTTKLTSGGPGEIITLANGSRTGQRKTIVAASGHTGGNTSVVTPATPASTYATVTLSAVRQHVELEWSGTAWDIAHTSGTVA